jgi:hypothetical protein
METEMTLYDMIQAMKHSPLQNYAGVPGLTSWLIGQPGGDLGTVRLLECSRTHYEPVTPHSHRFDFFCQVLRGKVRNLLWEEVPHGSSAGDQYQATELTYGGAPGKYERGDNWRERYRVVEFVHAQGDTYSMKHDQIHSIFFERGTCVLFLEGPTHTDKSVILEPVVDNRVVPTFDVRDWMFQKG